MVGTGGFRRSELFEEDCATDSGELPDDVLDSETGDGARRSLLERRDCGTTGLAAGEVEGTGREEASAFGTFDGPAGADLGVEVVDLTGRRLGLGLVEGPKVRAGWTGGARRRWVDERCWARLPGEASEDASFPMDWISVFA